MRTAAKLLLKSYPFLVGVIVVAGMLIFFNLNRASVDNELATLDLIPKPERLTELYFATNTNLPDAATSNQKVSFALN